MKKQIIRIVSLIIAVLIIAMSMPVGAFAASVPALNGSLSVNNSTLIDYYYSSPFYYSFVPEESGVYQISSSGEADAFVTVFDNEMNMLDSDDDSGENGNFTLIINLEKYNKYYVKIGAYAYSQFWVTVTKPDSATAISLYDSQGFQIESIYGHTDESMRCFVEYSPSGSVGEAVNWVIEDTEIATVDSYGKVTLKKEGKTTLTAISGDLTVSVPVVVSNKIEIVANVENSVSIPQMGDHLCMEFTALEAGDYEFTYSSLEGLYVDVYNVYGDDRFEYEETPETFILGLNEGEIVKIKVNYANSSAENFAIKVNKITYADYFDIFAQANNEKIYEDYYTTYVGESINFGFTAVPEDSVIKGGVTYFYSESEAGSMDSNGYFVANNPGYFNFEARSYEHTEYINVQVLEKTQLVLGSTYSPYLSKGNLGKFVGTFSLEEGKQNYRISFDATDDVTLILRNEYGEYVAESSGTEGVINRWLSDSFDYEIEIVANSIYNNDISCNIKVESYIPVSEIQIIDSEGNDLFDYNGEVDDSFTLGCKITPENADTTIVWQSENPDIASVDEYGNVYIYNPGYTYIYAYATDANGQLLDYASDNIRIYAQKITDTSFSCGHSIFIGANPENTERLRVRPTHSGYYSVYVSGKTDYPGLSLINTADNSDVELKHNWVSETEHRYSFYLAEGEEYIIWLSGNSNEWYFVSLEEYDVPSRIYICDDMGNEITQYNAYTGDTAHFNFKYDADNCYKENVTWKIPRWFGTVDQNGNVSFSGAGRATLTVTTESGLTASLTITVMAGKRLELDTPVTETLSYDGAQSVRFMFTPEVTGVYEIAAAAESEIHLNFSFLDSNFNTMGERLYSDECSAAIKMNAGETYYIKVYEGGMGGKYTFAISDKTIALNTVKEHTMPEGDTHRIQYYFIPEKSGFYLFKTSGYVDEGWGRGVDIYNDQNEMISSFDIEGNSSTTYVSLEAGKVYRASIFKNYWDAATFTFEVTEAVGISSLEILTMPTDLTVVEGSADFNFSGLSLNVIMSDGNSQTWVHDESWDNICGFAWSYSYSEEIDGKRYAYIKAGGAICAIPYTVRQLEFINVNTPLEITFGEAYDEVQYKFTPQKSGWHLFRSFNHKVQSDDRGMVLGLDGMWAGDSQNDMETVEMYAYLTAGETYVFEMYKHYWDSDRFTLLVTEDAVAVESVSIKQYPDNMTVYNGMEYDPDFSGLVLSVTTTDGQTRDWTYTPDAQRVLGYLFECHYNHMPETMECILYVGTQTVAVAYTIIEYPLESIEVITAGDFVLMEHTGGYYINETDYYYETYSFGDRIRLKLNFNDGTSKFISQYDYIDGCGFHISDFQEKTPWTIGGKNYFTVHFRDKQVNVPVTIVEGPVKMELVDDGDLTVTDGMGYYEQVSENEFIWTYMFDYSDVKVKIVYGDGTEEITSPQGQYKGINFQDWQSQYDNPLELGKENFVTIYYGDLSVNVPVTVVENNIKDVEITKKPDSYMYGDSRNGSGDGEDYYLRPDIWDGYEFTVTYNDGAVKTYTQEDVDYIYDGIDGSFPEICMYSNPVTVGTNKAYLAWGGKIVDFDIEVVESKISSIEVLKLPTIPDTLKYYPDMDGLELQITYPDSTSKTVTFTKDDFTVVPYYGIKYVALVDGEELVIRLNYETNYTIDYMGVSTHFNIGEEYDFGVTEFNIDSFDSASNTVTVSFQYHNNNDSSKSSWECFTLELGEATDISNQFMSRTEYEGVYKGEDGVFAYSFSVIQYEGELLQEYSISMLGDGSTRYATETVADINGDGRNDARDIVALKKLLAKKDIESETVADFDGDGNETVLDLAYLRKYFLGDAKLTIVDGDADGDGYTSYNDALCIATYLAGSNEILSSRADVNLDGVIDSKDIDAINEIIG